MQRAVPALVHRSQRRPGQGPHRTHAKHRISRLGQLITAGGQALVKSRRNCASTAIDATQLVRSSKLSITTFVVISCPLAENK